LIRKIRHNRQHVLLSIQILLVLKPSIELFRLKLTLLGLDLSLVLVVLLEDGLAHLIIEQGDKLEQLFVVFFVNHRHVADDLCDLAEELFA